VVARRFEVYLANLDPTGGSETQKTRPCLIIWPDEMNRFIRTVIVAPMTTKGRPYPTRVDCTFEGKDGQIVLDQIRTVDRARLIERLGSIDAACQEGVLTGLAELFAPPAAFLRESRRVAMSTLSPRLPESLHEKVEELVREEGISINQFLSTAVAEAMSALRPRSTWRSGRGAAALRA
jgi:mRNA interferase MazF